MASSREFCSLVVTMARGSRLLQCNSAASGLIYSAHLRCCSTVSTDSATASTSGQEAAPGWIGKEVKPKGNKDPFLSWVYMREGPDGVKRLMPWSERLIWGAVLGGIGYFFGPRIYNARKKAAEEQVAAKAREEQLHEKRLNAARLLLSGKTWVHDEAEAFEGMTPKQIMEFMRKHAINPDDPFEGMSPEEIDEFVRQAGVTP